MGGFLFGIPVGLVVCYLFFAVFLKKGSKNQEHSENSRGPVHMNHSQRERNDKQPLHNGARSLEQIVHRNPTSSKNVNLQENHSLEEDDVLTPLPFSKGSSHIQHTVFPQPPRYQDTLASSKCSEKDATISSPV